MHLFMTDHTATLVVADYKTKKVLIQTRILQGSPLSLILYLFYAAELLEACNIMGERISTSSFVNNTTLLTYGPSTKQNCITLIKAHKYCMAWAK